ncbi:MAG: hypothetical protein PHE27_07960, partial [Alphaproteobacteria bacterium]|nr:hypothetical protein [Alphaproteobacteria bacterium]
MSHAAPARILSRIRPEPFARTFFESPQPAGRKITAGFSYLQRIGKAGTHDVWFPSALKQKLERLKAEGEAIEPKHFPAHWAAVRQFELLHESGNHKIYDLQPERLQRAMLDLSKSMRAGGYRMTIATLGRYEETAKTDELEILDRRLQVGIAQMIHMLYLDEASKQANAGNRTLLSENRSDYRRVLPHIGIVLGVTDVFCPERAQRPGHKIARQFFDILNRLPQKHLVHDTAVGLQLPDLNGENHWNYIADPEETLGAFNRVLGFIFDKFDG